MANIINILQYLKCYLVLSGFLVITLFCGWSIFWGHMNKVMSMRETEWERVNFHKWTLGLLLSETAWASGQRFPSVMKNTHLSVCLLTMNIFHCSQCASCVELNDSRSRIAGRCSAVETWKTINHLTSKTTLRNYTTHPPHSELILIV